MCGIVGYYREGGIGPEQLREAMAALQQIAHRGPDGSGILLLNSKTGEFRTVQTKDRPAEVAADIQPHEYTGGFDLFLGHRRLSIIDLSVAGHQPMRDEKGNWIIFNGEIFNYIELREELKAKGYSFHTGTDTEVVLAAWREWGERAFRRFNGMWAFVLWDNERKEIVVSGDRFSIKPLYHLRAKGEFVFASEIKAFLCFKGRLGELNRENVSLFIDHAFLDQDNSTFFRNVNRIPPAHFSRFRPDDFLNERARFERYWDYPEKEDAGMTEQEAIESFNEIFTDAIRKRMRSDVEWGLTLSGGLDSGTLTYRIHSILGQTKGIKSFSAVFRGMKGDESEFIDYMRDNLGLDSYYTNPMDEFTLEALQKNIWHYDYPSQGTSFFAEYSVMKLAATKGIKVLLEGQGGDELFAGYHHHFYRWCRELLLHGHFIDYHKNIQGWSKLKDIPASQLHRVSLLELRQSLKSRIHFDNQTPEPQRKWDGVNSLRSMLLEDMTHLTLPAYLRTDDRDSMAFGIETRVPFLDYRLVELGMRMPSRFKIQEGWQKSIVRKAGHDVADRIRYRKDKKGFTTPSAEWIDRNKSSWNEYVKTVQDMGFEVRPSELVQDGAQEKLFRVLSLGLWEKQFRQSPVHPKLADERIHLPRQAAVPVANGNIRICARCVLDTHDVPDLTFDDEGICSYCRRYESEILPLIRSGKEKQSQLDQVLNAIRESGKGKKYDCIIGVSGGVDSTYLAYMAREFGLRPLVVHFDNGWNSELAVQNIENILNKLGFDLYTYVVDWPEFRDLQLSYIKAGVVDWEVPTDHGILALLYQMAWKHGIHYILSGLNSATEGILPHNFRWSKTDVANLRDIHSRFGTKALKTYPILPFLRYFYLDKVFGIKSIPLLNLMDYDKDEAKRLITEKLGWRDYGGKHYESIFTRFYQSYVLPERYGLDKRKPHFSTLINSGQMTREAALEELKKPAYDPQLAQSDLEYVVKKLGIPRAEFEKYMKQPIHDHREFATYESGVYVWHERFFRTIRPFSRIIKKFRAR